MKNADENVEILRGIHKPNWLPFLGDKLALKNETGYMRRVRSYRQSEAQLSN